MLPFTVEQFFSVFERYNTDLPFAGTVLAALAFIAAAIAFLRVSRLDIVPPVILAFLWAWAGAIYHSAYFAEVNPAAYGFGGLFLLQATLIAIGSVKADLRFRFRWDRFRLAGAVIMIYALVIYPILGDAAGHVFPRKPSFGVPCPVTIFTFGLLLWNELPVSRWYFVIPVMWMVIGSSAIVFFGVWEDAGMPAAAIVAIVLNENRRRKVQCG